MLFRLSTILLVCAALRASAAEPIDVYLIGGQSNATGQGDLKNLPPSVAPDPRGLLFHSGTNLHTQWAPGADASDRAHWGQQFVIFVETVDAGLAGLRDRGFAPVRRGMIWQQGENDAERADANANATEYGKNLAHLIARVREQFHAPDLVFVYGYVRPPPNVQPGRDAIRAGERDVAQDSGRPLAVKGAFVVATDDLDHRATDPDTRYPADHLHFGTAGTLELGRRLAEKMSAALAPPAK